MLRAMREVPFEVGGATRSYWHFYFGFGVHIGVLLTLLAVLLWQLGSIGADDVARIRPMLVAICAAFAIGTAVLWVYIFVCRRSSRSRVPPASPQQLSRPVAAGREVIIRICASSLLT